MLQEKVLHELADLCGAQSGALWVAGERSGLRLRAWHGLVDRKAMPERVDATLVQNKPWHAGTTFLVPLIAANRAQDALGADDNAITLFDARGRHSLGRGPKLEQARKLVAHVAGMLKRR